jgi:hypothetical protein
MLIDLSCPPEALRAAAAWVRTDGSAPDVTLARVGARLIVREGASSASFAAGRPAGAQQVQLTPQALRAAAAWAETGDGMADVGLRADGPALVVSQGDDATVFGISGEPASPDHPEAAPLDRRPRQP